MGYAFTYPIAKKLFGCKVLAYVHYPTISSDMLTKVQERRPGFNNDKIIAKNIVMVNSTWTKGHIDQLWGVNGNIIYPPCDTDSLSKLPLDGRERIIVSIAQFRDHQDFREGSGKENVKFEVNADFNTLVDWLSKAKVGLHTMWNEHFGIGIAAGIIPIAHNSGGPKMDIVIPYNDKTTGGFLANNEENFAKELYKVFSLSEFEYNNIQINARECAVKKFSEQIFENSILTILKPILDH
ncbi:1739_t:CDS:2 [Entrophospora sp. SA101]|nr:1739_t:CDS:2 [Entrophospora sp. SA101]